MFLFKNNKHNYEGVEVTGLLKTSFSGYKMVHNKF